MFARRNPARFRAILSTAVLLIPATAQAQVIYPFYPGAGRPNQPVFGQYGTIPSTFVGGGLYGYGTYAGAGGYGYGTYAGAGGYGYGTYAGTGNYGTYVGGMNYGFGLQPGMGGYQPSYSYSWGAPTTGQPGTAPRMRNTYTGGGMQTGQLPYYGTGPSALGSSYSALSPRTRPGAGPGTSKTADPSALAYATLWGGCLSFAPMAYVPASYVSTAVGALEAPARMREMHTPLPGVANASLSGTAPAEVEVLLPSPDAEVWFEGVKMRPIGSKRTFFTPPLERGSRYAYEVRIRWRESGEVRTDTREVQVRAGGFAEIDFTHAARKLP